MLDDQDTNEVFQSCWLAVGVLRHSDISHFEIGWEYIFDSGHPLTNSCGLYRIV